MSSIKYIKKSSQENQNSIKEYNLFEDILVIIKDSFGEQINLKNVLKRIEGNIPKKLFTDLDIIYVGKFKELSARQVESVYMDGAIYLSNEIIDEEEIYNSIIHELAHNIEKVFQEQVYGDNKLLEEFLNKRKQLKSILESNKLYCFENLYLNPDFTRDFDDFLFKKVGYDRLALLSSNLFISPYSATSLREYFAAGFEHCFCGENPDFLKKISPKLYNKIIRLTKM